MSFLAVLARICTTSLSSLPGWAVVPLQCLALRNERMRGGNYLKISHASSQSASHPPPRYLSFSVCNAWKPLHEELAREQLFCCSSSSIQSSVCLAEPAIALRGWERNEHRAVLCFPCFSPLALSGYSKSKDARQPHGLALPYAYQDLTGGMQMRLCDDRLQNPTDDSEKKKKKKKKIGHPARNKSSLAAD
ncbi:hypothetical protein B0J12DRAFT_203890 [Macrophomina phaseolina]|uniref:Secreted protein n=1 Tax=Macrophomina phaseolina TaxID=35725 RepID=A0ABQ8G236_9PEZI|nr:hypothetical protein B0J12DRAFT_203890 [Macrophomina phaseolina]